ncbi:MAG: hypothetical protein D6704_13090 [Nitrospirae bacterium]|nr:MAG: hypothetical protein D6704_13090 [Nitrospirota bacterium]
MQWRPVNILLSLSWLTIGLGLVGLSWIPAAWAHPIVNLQSPQSFIPDPPRHQYFIANANGEPGKRDNNGFISKLNEEGEMIAPRFIQGGTNNVILHSPYGLAIVDQILYVADIDTVRGFHVNTGEPALTISLREYQVHQLTDLIADGAGILFVADTEGNTIYRIDPSHTHPVSIYIRDQALAGPAGLAVHPRSGHLIVTSRDNGTVLEVNEQGGVTELISNSFFTGRFRNLSGIDFDRFGNMYVSDLTAGKVWRIQPDATMQVIAEFLISPINLRVDRQKHRILVPYLYANGAEMNGLELPTNLGSRKKKKRTLSDYGLGWLKGKD